MIWPFHCVTCLTLPNYHILFFVIQCSMCSNSQICFSMSKSSNCFAVNSRPVAEKIESADIHYCHFPLLALQHALTISVLLVLDTTTSGCCYVTATCSCIRSTCCYWCIWRASACSSIVVAYLDGWLFLPFLHALLHADVTLFLKEEDARRIWNLVLLTSKSSVWETSNDVSKPMRPSQILFFPLKFLTIWNVFPDWFILLNGILVL